ncbi:MAG: hypothetical protein ACRDTG_26085 [Pseudonocardiaceae bacterium]
MTQRTNTPPEIHPKHLSHITDPPHHDPPGHIPDPRSTTPDDTAITDERTPGHTTPLNNTHGESTPRLPHYH